MEIKIILDLISEAVSESVINLKYYEKELFLNKIYNNIYNIIFVNVIHRINKCIKDKIYTFYVIIEDKILESIISTDEFIEIIINFYGKYFQQLINELNYFYNFDEFYVFHIYDHIFLFSFI